MTDDRKTGGEVELLPCPWCGEAQSVVRVSEGSTFRWRKVDGCCADGPEVRHDTMADDQAAAEADSHRRAIEAWNTRANVDRALAESRAEALIDAKVIDSLINSNQELQAISARLASELSKVIARAGPQEQFITAAGALSDYAALNLDPTP